MQEFPERVTPAAWHDRPTPFASCSGRTTWNAALSLFTLVTLCGLLFFHRLGDRDLNASHEARAAQNAQMILDEGEWGLPRLFDRHLELQKPPLYYWLVALVARALEGHVDVWAVRLPAALSALGCVFFLSYLGWKRGHTLAGFLAALILATSLHFTWLARVGRIDMPLTLAVTLAVGCFLLGREHAARRWFFAGYLAVAAGVMLKGPVAAVFAIGITGAHVLLERLGQRGSASGSSWARSLLWGVPLVCLVAGPWFIWANIETGGKLWEVFFWHHNIERGLGGESLQAHPVWFYAPRALLDLLPWSLAIPAAIFAVRKSGWFAVDGGARLGAIWFVFVFVFLSLMRFKRADYLLPAFPGAALFLGTVAARWWEEKPFSPSSIRRQIAAASFAAIVLLTSGSWLFYNTVIIADHEKAWPYQRLADEIRRQTDMPVIFFRAEAHILAFHVGRPLDTILEWENLDVWASRDRPVYFVMPADCAAVWHEHLTHGRLEEVFRTSDHAWGRRERPLVVMRSIVEGR